MPVPLKTYSVHRNDNLYRVASRFQVSVRQLLEANPQLLKRPLIEGEAIRVPENDTHVVNHVQHQELQHTVPYPDEETLLAIRDAQREFFSVRQTNGLPAFEKEQKSIVGANIPSSSVALWQVQQALRRQGYLGADTEVGWYKEDFNQEVNPQDFLNTWGALRKFQQERQLDQWKNHAFFKSLSYTPSQVKPNDLTDWALRYFTRYYIQLEDVKSEIHDIRFENMVAGAVCKNPLGIVYEGAYYPTFSVEELTELGIPSEKANAVLSSLSSKNAFDFIQSYDESLFSFGFVKFSGDSLTKFLLTVMLQHPALYQVLFSSFGVDISYSWSDEKVEKAVLTLIVPEARGGEYILYDEDALLEIQRNKLLQAVFIRAGLSHEVAKLQVLSAVEQELI
ncbi:MAG: LysM peptidoglycan-binding domain-containing protein [Bacteroidota bacterium]